MPYQRLAEAALARWREVERQLAELPPESEEADTLKLESYRLREEYQHLIDQAVAHHRPVPPAFPKAN
jgi:phage terminase small subunit